RTPGPRARRRRRHTGRRAHRRAARRGVRRPGRGPRPARRPRGPAAAGGTGGLMEVVLLGTGAADGWPNAFCRCASCVAAAREGEHGGQSAALVDDVLLLDCGPEIPAATVRHGRTLAGVRHVLITHAHFDHLGPQALLARSWTDAEGE